MGDIKSKQGVNIAILLVMTLTSHMITMQLVFNTEKNNEATNNIEEIESDNENEIASDENEEKLSIQLEVPVIDKNSLPTLDDNKDQNIINVTEEEYLLLVRVCMSEAGNQTFEGKVAVLETVLNRVSMGYGTIAEIIYAKGQYSTRYNGEPTEECYKAVDYVLNNERMYDSLMIYFRTSYYHSFGKPYMKLGSHYFSLKSN